MRYRRRPSPLHAARAAVGAAYGSALALAALIIEHPLPLAALGLAALGAGAAAGVADQQIRLLRRVALPVVLLGVVVNLLVDRNGITVFARLGDWGPLGQVDLTVEALVYGLVFALRLLVVTLAASLVVCAVDPDELMHAARHVSHRSALTATLTTRLVPLLFEDARHLAEAQRCRPDGGARGTRARLVLLRAVVGGALDRSLDVAAALEVRAYGAGRRARRAPQPWSRHDVAFALAASGLLAAAIGGRALGFDPFVAYPVVHAPLDAGVLALSAAFLALALAPFLDRRGVAR